VADEVVVSLPAPRLSISGEGAVPAVVVNLPTYALTATGSSGFLSSPALTLPMFELAITGIVTIVGEFTHTIDLIDFSASGTTGAVGAVSLTFPSLQVAATQPDGITVALPLFALTATGHVGVTGGVSVALPVFSFSAQGEVPYTAGFAASLPRFPVQIEGLTGGVGSVEITLRRLILAAEGVTGTIGDVVIEMPVVDLSVDGYQPIVGYAQLTLPMVQLQATGRGAAQDAASTVVMNTETQALTTYSNFPFNSFARFNGVVLGACDTGLFALTGDTDDGVLIQAAARVGTSDFGTSRYKRIEEVVVGYRANGDLVLRVFTDETTMRDYRLATTGQTGLHGQTAKLGRGIAARYWQFEVRNQGGADFEMNMIELEPIVLPRKFGGRRA